MLPPPLRVALAVPALLAAALTTPVVHAVPTPDGVPVPAPTGSALLPAPAVPTPHSPLRTPNSLAARLDPLLAGIAGRAMVGLSVRSLDRGEELYALHADVAFVPASNQKLLVAAGALDALGPEFCFSTGVWTLGLRRGATLAGDLILRGGGDPTLVVERLAKLADAVIAAGIRRVTGRVRGDDSFLDQQRLGVGWSWDDEPFAYAAPSSGLTLNGNTVSVEIRPAARAGLPPLVRLDPPGAPLSLRVRAMTVPPGEPATLEVGRRRARSEILVSGRIPRDGAPVTRRVTVEDPAAYAAAVFTALLRARGVKIDHPPIVLGTPLDAKLLGEIQSEPLAQIVRNMNKQSDNLIAETLLKTMGVRQDDRSPGAGIGGRGEARLRSFLARAGVCGPALVLADGSGLSRQNLVSPRNLVQLLAAMDRHPARGPFFDSLPVAGVDGTLRRRMLGTPAAGVVRAKTGTLTHVSALTGVVTTRDRERLAFSILTNNFPGPLSTADGPRAVEDAVATALAEFRR